MRRPLPAPSRAHGRQAVAAQAPPPQAAGARDDGRVGLVAHLRERGKLAVGHGRKERQHAHDRAGVVHGGARRGGPLRDLPLVGAVGGLGARQRKGIAGQDVARVAPQPDLRACGWHPRRSSRGAACAYR